MSTKGKGQLVNRAELSDVFGVVTTTIDAWVRAGCPAVERGSKGVAWTFNTADVARWREDERAKQAVGTAPQDAAELDKRRRVAETLTAELTLAKARDEVAPVEEFERATSRLLATIRANIMNVPARAVLQLLGETNAATFKEKLRDELTLALTQSADADLRLEDEDDEQDENDE